MGDDRGCVLVQMTVVTLRMALVAACCSTFEIPYTGTGEAPTASISFFFCGVRGLPVTKNFVPLMFRFLSAAAIQIRTADDANV